MKTKKGKKLKRFACGRSEQFVLTFPDGQLSSVWGFGTYTDNHPANNNNLFKDITRFFQNNVAEHTWVGTWYKDFVQTDTIEVMYKCKNKDKVKRIEHKFGNDNPLGYLTFKEWLWLVNLMDE